MPQAHIAMGYALIPSTTTQSTKRGSATNATHPGWYFLGCYPSRWRRACDLLGIDILMMCPGAAATALLEDALAALYFWHLRECRDIPIVCQGSEPEPEAGAVLLGSGSENGRLWRPGHTKLACGIYLSVHNQLLMPHHRPAQWFARNDCRPLLSIHSSLGLNNANDLPAGNQIWAG